MKARAALRSCRSHQPPGSARAGGGPTIPVGQCAHMVKQLRRIGHREFDGEHAQVDGERVARVGAGIEQARVRIDRLDGGRKADGRICSILVSATTHGSSRTRAGPLELTAQRRGLTARSEMLFTPYVPLALRARSEMNWYGFWRLFSMRRPAASIARR